MPEFHAYGASCLCIGRRHFVLGICLVMGVICVFKVGGFVHQSDTFQTLVDGEERSELPGCKGSRCYEVLSCYGLKDTSQRVREPLASVSGLFFFPLGFLGALHAKEWNLRIFSKYLWYSFVGHALLIAFDVAFTLHCGMYPASIITQTLEQSVNFMTFLTPVSPAAQAKLRGLSTYPVGTVDAITHDFPALAWYGCFATAWALLIGYLSFETGWLGDLVERGPLGLGAHYGLDQWDEVINHDAIRILGNQGLRTQFVDDAKMPYYGMYAQAPFGYGAVGRLGGVPSLATCAPKDDGEGDGAVLGEFFTA